MKLSTKPAASPVRVDKYPPPLMRFLRSNVGSRSRSRSRSSPMFVRKKNAAVETQEPTSPKVTCMGQVRVKHSKQQSKNRTAKGKCECIKNTLFCRNFSMKLLKPRCSRLYWCNWVSFFGINFRRKSNLAQDNEMVAPKFNNSNHDLDQETDEVEEKDAKFCASGAVTPPKNALILTRSRSAPYRSSSLACRFWGPPLSSEETEQKQSKEQENAEEEDDDDSKTSKKKQLNEDSDRESRLYQKNEEKINFFKEFEGQVNLIRERISRMETSNTEEDGTIHPLILTRCKSEPARIAEKLDPDIISCKKKRLGFT